MVTQSRFNFFNSIPPVTKNIIIITFLCWLASIILPKIGVDLVNFLGLHFFLAPDFKLYQLVTYMFMHDTQSLDHIFFNMFAVFMFGRVLEGVWGAKRFIIFYCITGIGAAIIQELVWLYIVNSLSSANNISIMEQVAMDPMINHMITIGASGAVFGILLAFGMLFPNTPLYIMFVPIPIKAKFFVVIYGIIELLLGVANFSNDNVAHFAHLGGMLFGFILIKYWKKKDNNGRFIY